MHCVSTKEMWDKLQNIYEGDDKVKKEKLQTHRGQFETLKMNEEESIATYFLHVDEIVNTIRGLGEEVKETIIVQKVLRSLPSRFDPKISSIEEIKDLDNLKMDELHGILTAYEMRIEKDKKENPSRKEATFKASKKTKTKEYKTSDNSDSESDAEEANFVRKLKRGSGKYKGKIPFKCFNCGEVGHFVAKCPYAKNRNSNEKEDSSFKNYKKGKTEKRRKFYRQKKNLYTNEDNNSSDDSDSET
jgi:hypothetical protein